MNATWWDMCGVGYKGCGIYKGAFWPIRKYFFNMFHVRFVQVSLLSFLLFAIDKTEFRDAQVPGRS